MSLEGGSLEGGKGDQKREREGKGRSREGDIEGYVD